MTYYKAIRPDGYDFYTGTVKWAVEPGEIVRHPPSAQMVGGLSGVAAKMRPAQP